VTVATAKRKADPDPVPVFPIKGTDSLAIMAIDHYRMLCLRYGATEQAAEVVKAMAEIREWQARNSLRVRLPDHKHVPVNG
jgi:hypothetical protein